MIPPPALSPRIFRQLRGFTLVELLVVISIIGLLAGLAIPAISSGMNKAKEGTKLNNLRGIYQACTLWSSENDGRVVPALFQADANGQIPGWQSFLPTNTLGLKNRSKTPRSKDIFVDPFFKGYNTNTWWNCGYAMNTQPGLPLDTTYYAYDASIGKVNEMRMVALTYPAKRAFIIDAEVTYSFTPRNIRGGSGAYFATNRHGGGLGMVMMYDGHVEKLNMDQAYDSANDPSKR
jgi:prepilin-type N-terminal cleavage/methylation domain-containing protein/prepilin-type processing-associated H-X9-DG protein